MNSVAWNLIGAGTYCAPLSCQVAIVNHTISASEYIRFYDNMTLTQFLSWNTYIDSVNLQTGEVVCIGPPGGAYTPVLTAAAQPSVYTTTATPAEPTPAGTIKNCGLYYEVIADDECNTIALAYSLTSAQFMAMNPSLDGNCSNLQIGYDYCVALVNGTTITATLTTTATPTATAYKPAPTQTVSGTTDECYEWYIVQDSDTCKTIEVEFGITLAVFRALNTYIDASCSNLWLSYAYCVSGVAENAAGTGTTMTVTTTSTSTYVAAPTQTVSGSTAECFEWYVVQSGDTCETIEKLYGITLAYFISLNTYVNSGCSNIWPQYAYCVSGVADGTGTAS
ncbi:hypothetical protein BO99DRAFT_395918 [Aspergillus violaceofuscus CBS 115571]|uniref:LysM domain-containing protein n=1 Tax=Aspergillus violaceofuscus (strain CBS 115571) TaxID=1450538 RepID=A0A2V5I2K4_ASPV1|nr:hypothetical protein BO99DRAFT_395918 [Aspergillus violaceofuscus CBS 115571]